MQFKTYATVAVWTHYDALVTTLQQQQQSGTFVLFLILYIQCLNTLGSCSLELIIYFEPDKCAQAHWIGFRKASIIMQ